LDTINENSNAPKQESGCGYSILDAKKAAKALYDLLDNPHPESYNWFIKVNYHAARIQQLILGGKISEENANHLKRMKAKADGEEERDLERLQYGH
jgi:hypothetical protein